MNKTAFFDFDGTLTSCNCIHTISELKRLSLSPWRYRLWLLTMAAKLPFYWILNKTDCQLFNKAFFSEYRGMQLESHDALFKGKLLEFTQAHLFYDAITTINTLREQGWNIVIISASISAVVKPVADFLGIDTVYCNELQVENGIYTGKLEGMTVDGINKAVVINNYLQMQGIDNAKCRAYGNSYWDVAMLNSVGKSICINPDRRLRIAAKKNNWEIIHWQKIVRNINGET